jgi:hypothetical protein
MIRRVLLLSALTLALSGALALAAETEEKCKRYCITVSTKKTGDPRVIAYFQGSRWKPDSRIRVRFGSYCPPGGICTLEGYNRIIRTDEEGRFRFHFQRAPKSETCEVNDGVPGASGRGPLTFFQGRAYRMLEI